MAVRTKIRVIHTCIGFCLILPAATALATGEEERPALQGEKNESSTQSLALDARDNRRKQESGRSEPGSGALGGRRRSAAMEEVVVTAQKREERLQDVPISISVLGGADLDTSTVRSVTDALSLVPGVATATDPTNARIGGVPRVIVRGLAPMAGASTVAYYLDSIPFGNSGAALAQFATIAPDPSAYDLKRVEVLRGPQGTLYGLSASNGVVRVLTENADLERLEFKARTSAATTDYGSESYRGDMAVNVPIVEGKLAARAVVGYQQLGGWIDKPSGADSNDVEIETYRLKVNAQPTEQLSVGLFGWLSRSDTDASAVSPDGRHSASVLDDTSKNDYDAYGLNLSYQLPSITVTNTTSYLDYTIDAFVDFSVLGVPNILVQNRADSKVFADEFVINSNHGGVWRWTIGSIYRDGKVETYQLRHNVVTGGFGAPYLAPNVGQATSESFAVFGELTRMFFERKVELTVGLRYFDETLESEEISAINAVGGVPPSGLIHVENEFESVTPRAVLAWHPNTQSTVYASYGEGFRSGLNQTFATERLAPGYPPAKSDLLRNYEVGFKGSMWDGHISIEAAAFYMDWQDVQTALAVLVQTQSQFFVTAFANAASASGPGFEIATTFEPIDDLSLGLNFGWNDLKIDEDIVGANGAVLAQAGTQLAGSPDITAAASADYGFAVGSGGYRGRLSASTSYLSRFITGASSGLGGARTLYSDPLLITRASIAVESPWRWTASLFVDNLTNENGVAARDPFTPEWNARVRPRTIGLQLEYRY